MDQENIKAEQPSTPQNPIIKEEFVGSASTWGSKELNRFNIELDQTTPLNLKDIIDEKWFNFSESAKLDQHGI